MTSSRCTPNPHAVLTCGSQHAGKDTSAHAKEEKEVDTTTRIEEIVAGAKLASILQVAERWYNRKIEPEQALSLIQNICEKGEIAL